MITWDEILEIHRNLPPPPPPPTFRLYYDQHGRPIVYNMEDLPGNYIEVDRETYVLSPTNAKVIDGKLVILLPTVSEKLRPSETGTPCHPCDVSIVDSDSTTYWSKHHYGLEQR